MGTGIGYYYYHFLGIASPLAIARGVSQSCQDGFWAVGPA